MMRLPLNDIHSVDRPGILATDVRKSKMYSSVCGREPVSNSSCKLSGNCQSSPPSPLAATFSAVWHLHPLTSTKLYCLVTKGTTCLRLLYNSAQSGIKPVTYASPYLCHHATPSPSAGPMVIFPVARHQRPLTGTKLYCLVTECM